MTEWIKFKKRPVVVEAYKWNGKHDENVKPVKGYLERRSCPNCPQGLKTHGIVQTSEGPHIACPTDYIIRGVKGEIYPCKEDIFEMTYDKV